MLRTISIFVLALPLTFGTLRAQRWELGVGAGAGIYPSKTVTRGSQSATTGFDTGVAISAFIGQNMYRRIGGEVRYTWQMNNLKLQSGSTKVTFGGQSHAMEYNLLYHFTDQAATLRPYVLGGGGMKYYQGTGTEMIVQPLNNFAYLTRTGQWKPLFSVGGGIKYRLGPKVMLRVEARDSITPFPDRVIAPAAGASIGGWLNDYVIFAGILLLL